MLDHLARRLQLEPAELRHALTLSGMLFSITSSYTLTKTARDAMFLAHLPASDLPYVYLGAGLLTVIVSLLFTRVTRRVPTWMTLAGTALVAAISLAVFAWAFGLALPWVPVAFYVWVNLYGLMLTSQFWNFTNSISDPREAKRIFGIVGGGGILGGLVGGLVAARLGSASGLAALLVVASGLVALTVPAVWAGVHHGTVPPAEAPPGETGRSPFRADYVRWLALAALCSVLVTGLLDYQFKVEIQQRYPTPAALARFFGLFYVVMNLIALTFQLIGTRWSLEKLGAGWSAAVLPAGLGAGALATMTNPVFGSIVGTRLWDQVMRMSLNRSAVEMFYFPLEPGLRRRAKALIDAGLERMGDALSGLVILGLGVSFGASTWTVALVVAMLVIVWLAAWFRVRRGYVDELGRNLRRMNLDPAAEPVTLREAAVRGASTRLLASPWSRVVLHGIDLIEQTNVRVLRQQLPRLLSHPSAEVRARALEIAAAHWPERAEAYLAERLADPDPLVRLAALRVRAGLDHAVPLDVLAPYLASDDAQVRAEALGVALAATPDDDPPVRALAEQRLQSPDPADRAALARALGGRRPAGPLHAMLDALLDDADLEVRRAALGAAGSLGLRRHVPVLLEALARPDLLAAARDGLAMFGDRVTGTLGDHLADVTVPVELRRELPRVLGEIPTQESAHALMRVHDRSDVPLSTRLLQACTRIRLARRDVVFPADRVSEDIAHDVRSELFALVNYRSCPLGDRRSGERLLCVALNERMEQALERVFRRLALLYPPREIRAAWLGTSSDDPKVRGHALEYLENALSVEHRELVMPLLDDRGDEGRLAFAAERFGLRYGGWEASLRALLLGEDAWLRTLALHIVGEHRLAGLAHAVDASLDDRDWRVRETARWAHAALAA